MFFDEVEWFQRLPSTARDRVLQDSFETSHPRGGSVVRIGDAAHSWIGVAQGLLKVVGISHSGRMQILTSVSHGGWIGEGAVVKRELRRYEIVAMRESRLVHIPASTFRWLLDTSFEFNHAIITQLNERLSQYITMVEIDRSSDPVERVARMIAVLFDPVLYPRMTTVLPMSHSELGELVGLGRQSIGAALKHLETRGHLTTQYGGIVVKDITALRNFESAE